MNAKNMGKTAKILIADDDRSIRMVLSQALTRHGYEVEATEGASPLWNWVSQGIGDLVITDIIMPDGNGLDLVTRIRDARPDLRVIVMSAQNTLKTAIQATERGAFEYLPKPFDLKDLISAVERALTSSVPVQAPDDDFDPKLPLTGRSPAMQEIYRLVSRMTTSDLTVMVTGEPGTGKELVAKALHMFGPRRNSAFIGVNIAALPQQDIESDLFGHDEGAKHFPGRFEQAEGGTLFIDEVGALPLEAQTRLLRFLQEKEITPVGGRTAIRSNVRIIVATHRDLRLAVRQGSFREDLFYRLNVVPIRMPPLRERLEDIPELVRHFLVEAAGPRAATKMFTPAALERLKAHHWPGNVRELENFVRRLQALYAQDVIDTDLIASELTEPVQAEENFPRVEGLSGAVESHLRDYFAAHQNELPSAGVYDRVLREVERPLIILTLAATRGNQIKAAEVLGLNRNTLRKKIRDLDIPILKGQK
jgi:two-component system nitrogen regulation response regulator GlnG